MDDLSHPACIINIIMSEYVFITSFTYTYVLSCPLGTDCIFKIKKTKLLFYNRHEYSFT